MPLALSPVSGVNFGGWLSQSPLTPQHLQTFITAADFQAVAAAGFNTVRLPFNAKLVFDAEAGLLPDGLAWLDQALAWSKASGLRLILDLHEVPGHSFVDAAQNDLYQNRERQMHAQRLWRALAVHYLAEGDQLWFELLNEAVAPSAADWQRVAEGLLGAIREADERRIVVMGSNFWNGPAQFAELKKLDDPRIVYTFHFYEPHSFTHQGAPWVKWAKQLPTQSYPGTPVGLREAMLAADIQAHVQADHLFHLWDKAALAKMLEPVLAFQAAHQVPIFCGEFGVYHKAPRPDQLRWIKDFTELLADNGFGFTYWSWRGMDYGVLEPTGKWSELPQYQNAAKRDEELLAALARCAALLKG